MKNIVFITASVCGGGAERVLLNIINSLSQDKYRIFLINTASDERPSDLSAAVVYYALNYKHSSSSILTLRKLLKKIKPNYAFTTSGNIGYILAILKLSLCNSFKAIVRVAIPPTEIPDKSFRTRFVNYMIKLLYRHVVDTIIAQTEYSKQDIINHYSVKENSVLVIRNIIDKSLLDSKSCEFNVPEFSNLNYNIVASGALYSVKGFDLLIKACESIIKANHNVHLYILGKERYEKDYSKTLLSIAKECEVQDNIHLLGHKINPYPFYKSANLFVLSSRTEGFPNVVLENLYLGTPVVATDCVDFSNVIIEGYNGYVVSKNSVEALHLGILKAMEDFKKPILSEVENFDYDNLFK